jgi:hypothetical protein
VGRGKEERGRGGRTHDAADAPRPEAVRVGGGPYQSPRGRKEAVRVGRDAGPKQGQKHRHEHLRRTTVYPEPTTTTPSTRRERPAAIFFFPSPLDGELDLPMCWPSSRRTAAPQQVGALGLFMLPSSPSPCDVPLWMSAVEPLMFLQGTWCAAAPPRAAPLVSRWLHRANCDALHFRPG